MTPHDLIARFDELVEAPDGVSHVRELVLQSAVRGALVPQVGAEGTAANAQAAARAASADVARTRITVAHEADDPFAIPSSWRWLYLGEATGLVNGRAFKPTDWTTTGTRIVRIQNLNNHEAPFNLYDGDVAEKFFIDDGDLLVSWSGTPGTSFGAFVWRRGRAILNQHIFRCEPRAGAYDVEFLRLAINSRLAEMISRAHGAVGLQHITKGELEGLKLPLPPLAEQRRIVARVDELMKLIDQLDAARTRREQARVAFRDSALSALQTATTMEEVELAWTRIRERFDVVYSSAGDVTGLRRVVRLLAVNGYLTSREPEDEHAHLPPADDDEPPRRGRRRAVASAPLAGGGVVPIGWISASLGQLGTWAGGAGFPPDRQGRTDGEALFCKVSDMNLAGNEHFIVRTQNTVDAVDAAQMGARLHPPGTVIWPKIGGAIATNKRRLLTRPTAIDNNCMGLTPNASVLPEYLHLLLSSIDLTNYQAGTTLPALSQGVLASIPVIVPPIAEQHRIVARVSLLMSSIDKLEGVYTLRDAQHASFAAAAVHHLDA